MWDFFRRLLLGIVVDALLTHDVALDFGTLEIGFDPVSEFRVPRLNNYMRFKGALQARLDGQPADGLQRRLEADLRKVWPDLLTWMDIPIGDRLTNERNTVSVTIEHRPDGSWLRVAFDLVAD